MKPYNFLEVGNIRYNLDWALEGMRKFDRRRNSKEYQLFKKCFIYFARKASNRSYAERVLEI